MKLNEIKKRIQVHRPDLAKKFHVKRLSVFGSYARGEQKTKSDVDMLVEFSERVNFFQFLDLEDYLRKILHVRKVDLVTKRALKPRIGRRILKEAIQL